MLDTVGDAGSKILALDLCCGLKGASQSWASRPGWEVITLDIEPSFEPDIVADLRSWSWRGRRPDLLWCSFPCNEFSRESMPWCRTGFAPDMSIYQAACRIRRECNPVWWVFENVRGAQRWIGESAINYGPFHLWTNLSLPKFNIRYRSKESMSSSWRAERAKIPARVSLAVALAVEQTLVLF